MRPFKREIEYFLILCQTLNISKAAEEIGIQQAGMSKSLGALEKEMGEKLFFRGNRGLTLTPYGENLQRGLLKTLGLWEEVADNELSQESDIAGRFSIGCHLSVAANFIPRFLPSFLEKYPKVKIDLNFNPSKTITQEVINHQINFGIVAAPLAHPDLVIIPLKKEYTAVWSPKKNKKTKVIYYNPEMLNIKKILKNFKELRPIPISDYELLANILKNSQGLGILPNTIANRYPFLEQTGAKLDKVDICLIYNHETSKTKTFKLLVDSLKKSYI